MRRRAGKTGKDKVRFTKGLACSDTVLYVHDPSQGYVLAIATAKGPSSDEVLTVPASHDT